MAGTLDKTFGTTGQGWTTSSFYYDQIESSGISLVTDDIGNIFVAGSIPIDNILQIFIAKYKSNGVLDTNFGTSGYVYTPFSVFIGGNRILALDTRGNIFITGYITNAAGIAQLIVAKYKSNGKLDTNFGTTGEGWTANTFYNDKDSGGTSLLLDNTTGNIFVTGFTYYDGDIKRLIVVKYTSNGTLDTSFNSAVWTANTLYDGKDSVGTSLVLDNSGNILVVGDAIDNNYTGQLLVVKYTRNGALDTSFNSTGWRADSFYDYKNSRGTSLVLDNTTGNIFVTGDTENDDGIIQLLVVKYTSNGALDTTFNSTDGWTAFYGDRRSRGISLVLDNTTGDIFVTGDRENDNGINQLLVVKYTSNGALDTTFGTNGLVVSTFYDGKDSAGASLVLNTSDNIIVTGFTKDNVDISRVLLAKYNSNGDLNSNFGTNGWTATVLSIGKNSFGSSVVTDSGGNIFVFGETVDNTGESQIIIAKYSKNGILDTDFGDNGWITLLYEFTDGFLSLKPLAIHSDGNIFITGFITNTSGINQLIVAKYKSNGELDTTFGINGLVVSTFYDDKNSIGASLVLDTNGNIFVLGFTDQNFLLVKYNSKGELANNFGTNGQGWNDSNLIEDRLSLGLSLVIDTRGNIFVTGYTGELYLFIAKYDKNGLLADDFGTNNQGWTLGYFTTYLSSIGYSLALDTSGNIFVTGIVGNGTDMYKLLVAKYTNKGILANDFGTNNQGWVVGNFYNNKNSIGSSILLDTSGNILVAGSVKDNNDTDKLLIAKYTNRGSLDTSFGTNSLGWTASNFTLYGGTNIRYSVLNTNDDIIVVGSTNDGIITQLLLAKYLNYNIKPIYVPAGTGTIQQLLLANYLNANIEPICLPAGTPILTDQGTIPIDLIDPGKHTIANKRIVAITRTITPEKYLVCFEANSIGINCPSKRTLMTPGHEVLYKGKLVQAKHFIGRVDGVHSVPYNGKDVLYNVLQERHGLMKVNNMVLETLHPENKVAKALLQ